MPPRDFACLVCVLAVLLAALSGVDSANDEHLQDDETLNLLNGGLVLKRVGSVRLNSRVVSRTFAVPLPLAAADFGWRMDSPCVFGNFTLDCKQLPALQLMRGLLDSAQEHFQSLISLLPQLNASKDGAQLLQHLVLQNPSGDFAPRYPQTPQGRHFLDTTPDKLYGGMQLAARLQAHPYKLGFATATFTEVSRAVLSYLRYLDSADSWVNDLRNHSGQALHEITSFLEDYSRRLSEQVVSSTLGLRFLGDLSQAVQELHAGFLVPLLVPRSAVERALQDFNVEAQARRLPFQADAASFAYNQLRVSGAVFNNTLFITVPFYVDHIPRLSYDVFRVDAVPIFLNIKQQYGSVLLTEVPPYFVVSEDRQTYVEMSAKQLARCTSVDGGICTEVTAVSFANHTQSCLWAYFRLDRQRVNKLCQFRASGENPPKSVYQYAKGYALLTDIASSTIQKDNLSILTQSCPGRQCIIKVFCLYSIKADIFTIPARNHSCFQEDPKPFQRSITNLPVGFKVLSSLTDIKFLNFNLFIDSVAPVTEVSLAKLREFDNFWVRMPENISLPMEVRRPPLQPLHIDPHKRDLDSTMQTAISIVVVAMALGIGCYFLRAYLKVRTLSGKLASNDFGYMMQDEHQDGQASVSFRGLLQREEQEDHDGGRVPFPQSWHCLFTLSQSHPSP